jgi:hypothetical protein
VQAAQELLERQHARAVHLQFAPAPVDDIALRRNAGDEGLEAFPELARRTPSQSDGSG